MDVYENIRKSGYELPPSPPKGGIYKPVKQVGNLLYISGQGATKDGQPDGASQLLKDIFGDDNGVGARSAISAIELPGNISVEIEFIFEI